MVDTLSLEQLIQEIDGPVRTSSWITIDQHRIDQFAEVTEDDQFIHVDEARAKAETPFGGTIAHGFLTLSLLSAMVIEVGPNLIGSRMGINYGFEKIRFLAPVKRGSRVRGHFKTVEVVEKSPGNILVNTEVSVEIEGEEKPALVANWLGLTILEQEISQ